MVAGTDILCIFAGMEPQEIHVCYQLLLAVARDNTLPVEQAYRLLRELLERVCRSQMTDSCLQMTDLAARVSYVAAKVGLTTAEQNRLHTFRLASNCVLNRQDTGTDTVQLLRDVKTLAFFVQRLSQVEMPSELRALLPHTDATWVARPSAVLRTKCLRVSFEYAEGNLLYVRPLDCVSDRLCPVRVGVEGVNAEFAKTCDLLWRHAQLNLLDVTEDNEGVLTPAFLILEPDYLLDISALAECFKEFGSHPANYLYARLQPAESTAPLLLGNIANLFLDEWIHASERPDYVACMKKAFRQYSLELTACPDLQEAKGERAFFEACRMHFDHIGRTVTETFREPGFRLDKDDALLEPSYICEALGLQGRLDYMQRTMEAFIEMKSGKADEYSLRGKVEPKENNRVQMLLYQAVLEYAMGRDHHTVRPYLLYTRYPLLYPARASWAMLRRVMDVRNRIVAGEYGIQLRNSPHYTALRLAEINPQTLNERQVTGKLWTHYTRPAIEEFGARLAALTPLERSYFYTLYNFITKELYTVKSGDVDYVGCYGAASLWRATLEEKLEAGEIMTDLRLVENRADDAVAPCVVLEQPETSGKEKLHALPNFRKGDAVLLYSRNTPGDKVTNQLVFKATIEKIDARHVSLRLRAAQRNVRALPATSYYAVEHDATMDTSFRAMYQGLSAFLRTTSRRRAWLLGQRAPEFDTSLDAAVAATTDDFSRVVCKAEAARDCFLLIGPPGTGKTSRALRGMVERFYAKGEQLLLLSYTNRAVDEICKTLTAITPSVDFLRMGGELTCDEAYRPYRMEEMLAACANRREARTRLERCCIVVGTVATLSSRPDLFRLKRFDVAIVDEATQILEPQLLGLLCARAPSGEEAIGRFVLIGDHKQLPAVVVQAEEQSEVCDESLRAIGLLNLKDSLFERFYRTWHACGGLERGYDMLCRQGRMNPAVADFPNRAFYHGRLLPVGLPHQQGTLQVAETVCPDGMAPLLSCREAFIPSQPEPLTSSSKVNHCEARVVAWLAQAVCLQYQAAGGFDPARTLGIITPYRSQIALIRRELEKCGEPLLRQVLVDTVERFQGSERDVIIYSFCVNHISQLRFLSNLTEDEGVLVDRKLNVALTRARCQMFLTGVPDLLRCNPIYAALLQQLPSFPFPD